MDIDSIKAKIKPILIQAGVSKSALFGSYSRGEQRFDSDVDILVELPAGKSLFDLVGLQLELEDVLQKKVDLVEYGALKKQIIPYVQKDQIQIL